MIDAKTQITNVILLSAAALALLTYCNPAPAQSLRDPFSTHIPVPADPYYTQYPFQTPSQASRQLADDRQQRRNIEAITDATAEAQRRSDAAADARDFQRRLEAIK